MGRAKKKQQQAKQRREKHEMKYTHNRKKRIGHGIKVKLSKQMLKRPIPVRTKQNNSEQTIEKKI